MAAPTDVRVFAISQTSAQVRWTYPGTASISVFRSTNGTDYTELTSIGNRVAVGTTSYDDTTLGVGTKYWYKLSEDDGSTFSSVVTVVSHTCLSPASGDDTFSLPRTNGESPGQEFDELAERIEAALNGRVLSPDQCAACPEDGAIVIDCSSGCDDWVVVADEDINSISVQWCGETPGTFEFIVPPNTTRQICGWPAGFGFGGDECFRAPIVTGAAGRSVFVGNKRPNPRSKKGYNPGIGTGGMGGTACTCVTDGIGQLTIKSCNSNNSLNCSSSKSAVLKACGGKSPYTWSNTGSVTVSPTTGATVTVRPPTNSGSAVAGVAYWVSCWTCNGANCTAGDCASIISPLNVRYNCDDTLNACSTTENCTPAPATSEVDKCCNGNTNQCLNNDCIDVRTGGCTGVTTMCDQRTAQMITDGCSPCGLNEGATVTVTDAVGTQVTIVMKA
jgi:hypothetical protein